MYPRCGGTMLKVYILALILHVSFCQNGNYSNGGRSYFFRMGRKSSEFKVNNRIYYLNHNITDYDYTHKPVDNVKIMNTNNNDRRINNNHDTTNYLLDEEWNFDHENITKRDLPLFIHKLYESQTQNVSSLKTTRILFNCNSNKPSKIITFNLNSLQSSETVLDAELYFFWPLKESSKVYRESVVLRLYQFERQPNGALNESNLIENPDIHKLFNVIYISKAQRGWQTFKIKKPIDNWLSGEENLGLLLTISGYDDNELISVFNDTNEGIYSTFAIVTVQNNDTVDSKNGIADYNSHGTSPYCQRKEWNVSFKYLHWSNFTITPDGFTAYDCTGKCVKPQAEQVNHVKFLHMFNKRSPCCVPAKYLPLPIMFYDKYGNVVIKNYQNMIVMECGCR